METGEEIVTQRELLETPIRPNETDTPDETLQASAEIKRLPNGIEQKWVTIFLFVQFFANLFTNIDTGIIPAGSR